MPQVERAPTSYGQLPVAFIPNMGQLIADIVFQAHAMGGTVSFSSGKVQLALPAAERHAQRTAAAAPDSPATQGPALVSIEFEGAAHNAGIVGVDRLPGAANYIRGSRPADWHIGLPTFAGISYQQLYPGVDLRYEGIEGQLKGTYVLAPHSDPRQIQWRYRGAEVTQIDPASGDLRVTLAAPGGDAAPPMLTERAPVAWQTIAGRRVDVPVRYELRLGQSIGFALGAYDPAYPLTIDPTLVYSTYFGGSSIEFSNDIAIDGTGNAYIVGTTGPDLPTTNPLQPNFGGNSDIFIAKLNAAGSSVLYSTFLGGSSFEEGNSIAVDSAGNAYVTGSTSSTDFPTVGPLQDSLNSFSDSIVAKLSPAGDALLYSTYLGGDSIDIGNAIAIDSAGRAYVTGRSDSTDFGPPVGDQLVCHGSFGAFVARLNPAGDTAEYRTCLGGTDAEFGYGIAVDADGSAYVVGSTSSADFPVVAALQPTMAGLGDAFITKLNPAGDALLYSSYFGGTGSDGGQQIALDATGALYIAGNTNSADLPLQRAIDPSYGGGICTEFEPVPCSDAFVLKLSPDGSTNLFSTYLGGSNEDRVQGLAVSSSGVVALAGITKSSDLPLERGLFTTLSGISDAFVAQIDTAGASLSFSTYLGGSSNESAYGIAMGQDGALYVTGATRSNDFPTFNPAQPRLFFDGSSAFITKLLSQDGPLTGLGITSDGPTTLGQPTIFKATLPVITPATFVWNFGDGSGATGASVTHTYAAPRSYTVTLTASNSTGSAQATTTVAVVPPLAVSSEVLGGAGGGVPTVAISGQRALIGEGTQLTILDISNPTAPVRLGGYTTREQVQDIEISGTTAYVTDDHDGLLIFDIGNPAAPRLRGQHNTPGHALDVQVVGTRAYIADFFSLRIVDVSNPAAPTLLGSYPTEAYDLAIVNNVAYIATGFSFSPLLTLDVSNPANPTVLNTSSIPSLRGALGVFVANKRAYLAAGDDGLFVLDVSKPQQPPQVLGQIGLLGRLKDVFVDGNLAYAVNYDGTLHIIDVSSSRTPRLVTSYDTPGNSWDVRVVDQRAYVADGIAGLQILNVKNRRRPIKLGSYAAWSAEQIDVVGTRGYVSGGASMQIVDLARPAQPQLLGRLDLRGWAVDTAVVGNRAYVARQGRFNGASFIDGGLEVVDVSDPTRPRSLGSVPLASANAVQAAGNYVYVVGEGGLFIFDASNPAAPVELSHVSFPGGFDIEVVDNRAYIAGASGPSDGLAIYDVSNPAAPTLLGGDFSMFRARTVAVAGQRAFVGGGDQFRAYDVSDPAHPTFQGIYFLRDGSAHVTDLAVDGIIAYVVGESLNDGTIEIVDVSKTNSALGPTYLSEVPMSGLNRGLQLDGRLAYVAAAQTGLQVLRIRIDFAGSVPTALPAPNGVIRNFDRSVEVRPTDTRGAVSYTNQFVPAHTLVGAVQSFMLTATDGNGRAITQSNRTYSFSVTYRDSELAALGVNEARLNMLFWNGSGWRPLLPCTGCSIDPANNRITVQLRRYGEFALAAWP